MMEIRRTWRAPLLVSIATTAAPLIAVTGLGSLREGGSPLPAAAGVLAGLGLLGYLIMRQRRLLAVVVAAGVLGGWSLGLGIRLAMFVAAEMGGGVERSVGGTVGLILFFALPGIVLSGMVLTMRAVRPFGPVGTAIVMVALCGAFIAGPVRGELIARGNGAVNAVTFLASAVLAGLVLGRTQTTVEGWWTRRQGDAAPVDPMT